MYKLFFVAKLPVIAEFSLIQKRVCPQQVKMSFEQDIDWLRIKDLDERMMIKDFYEAAEKAGLLHLFKSPISFFRLQPGAQTDR